MGHKRQDREGRSDRGWLFYKYPLTPIEVFEGETLDRLNDKHREVMRKWGRLGRGKHAEGAGWKCEVWDKLSFDIIQDYIAVNRISCASEVELDKALKQHEVVLGELELNPRFP